MSYCRFGWDGSQVYVYESDGGFECCGCWLKPESWTFETPQAMIAHLVEHRLRGHYVPEYAIRGLWDDIPGASVPSHPEPSGLTETAEMMREIRENLWVDKFEEAEALTEAQALTDEQEQLIRRFIRWHKIVDRATNVDIEAVELAAKKGLDGR